MKVEDYKLTNLLNDKIDGKSFISEIRQTSWNEVTNRLYTLYTLNEFINDDNGDGFHIKRYKSCFIEGDELKKSLRNVNIDILLNENKEVYNLESSIYNPEKLARLKFLRDKNRIKNRKIITIYDYYSKFKIGDKAIYKGIICEITFIHKPKENGYLRFTVKFNNKEVRYVNPFFYINPLDLLKCKKSVNYDEIDIPKILKSKTTKQLLYILNDYRKHKYSQKSILKIKAELSKREHIPNKFERRILIANRHSRSKSKNR